jgi:pyruvate formate lyase activating enzyme
MLDYPGRLASVVFLGGCNFRCPFCHNPELVLSPERLPSIDPEAFLEKARERKKWVEGIVLGGGEPTLHPGLPEFIKRLKEAGLKVKLDTNGSNPKMLAGLLEKGWLDFVAMDVKTSKREYERLTGLKGGLPSIEESVELIKKSKIDYEFRTTVVPNFFNQAIAREMAEWLKGSKKYVLQQFNSENLMVEEKLVNEKAFTPDELRKFSELFKPFVEKVETRGI